MEQDTGVEPASAAWEAAVLPMYESCVEFVSLIASFRQKSNRFLANNRRAFPKGQAKNFSALNEKIRREDSLSGGCVLY